MSASDESPAGTLTVRAQDLLPGDRVDVLTVERIVSQVDVMPSSRVVWVRVDVPGHPSLAARVPLWLDDEVICTRREAA